MYRTCLELGLALVLGVFACRKDPGPRRVMEMNIWVVRNGEVESVADYIDGALRKFLGEPYGRTQAEKAHMIYIREQRAFYQATYTWDAIASWLAGHFDQGSDIAITRVDEFESLARMEAFLGGKPEEVGIPIPMDLVEEYEGHELRPASEHNVRFVTARAPVFFSSALFPAREEHRTRGGDFTVLQLLEETGVVDRWGAGYFTARGRLYSTLLFRARGTWLMWPFISGR